MFQLLQLEMVFMELNNQQFVMKNQQCLTNDQEEILADWIIELIEQDEPPTHQ